MANVILENVWKIYPGAVTAVQDFSLEIQDKEFLVLVGPSGCGKSTTLRMIAGLEEITRGTIRIGDRVVNDVPPKKRDIAMVFQSYALYPHMSVFDNMGFCLKLRRLSRADIRQRVETAARKLGLLEYLERWPKELSGGQRQRVALGRAIVREPSVFLFDEPLSNLDAKMRVETRSELIHLHQDIDTTMIYVTHDQVEAMILGDRIVVMNDGLIMQAAEPTVVYHYPANTFVARFIGTLPMNLLAGTLEKDGDRLWFDGGAVKVPLPPHDHPTLRAYAGKKVYFGVRPEDLELREQAGKGSDVIIAGTVDFAEKLGNEILVHLRADPHQFIIRLDTHKRPLLEGVLEVCPQMGRIHIFDGETGANLTLPDYVSASVPSPAVTEAAQID